MSEIKTNKLSPRKGTTQTIGDSGDTVTISSGATLSNAGTISGIQNIDWDTIKKTSAFTAVNQTGYFVDTTSGAITVTFPASPSAGNVIGIKDYALTADTNNITINPNGNNINGSSSNYIINTEGSAAHFIYVDATRGWVLTDASKASDITGAVYFTSATGGCITTSGDFKIHTFTGPGTFTVTQLGNAPVNPLGGPGNVDYLVVAGGGGGGNLNDRAGGGGAGGYRTTFPSPSCNAGSFPVSITGYPITVGGGGSAGQYPVFVFSSPGSNSVFSTITSTGGGRGGNRACSPSDANPGDPGGSGGGGSGPGTSPAIVPGGSGNTPPVTPSQGNNGGQGQHVPGSWAGGGGGGGSGGVGTAASQSSPTASAGGPGTANSITASPVTYAGGGGGTQVGATVTNGAGGPGGGGAGNSGGGANAGTDNTGGGGGGGYSSPGTPNVSGGAGGSGIVIIRYKYQ